MLLNKMFSFYRLIWKNGVDCVKSPEERAKLEMPPGAQWFFIISYFVIISVAPFLLIWIFWNLLKWLLLIAVLIMGAVSFVFWGCYRDRAATISSCQGTSRCTVQWYALAGDVVVPVFNEFFNGKFNTEMVFAENICPCSFRLPFALTEPDQQLCLRRKIERRLARFCGCSLIDIVKGKRVKIAGELLIIQCK